MMNTFIHRVSYMWIVCRGGRDRLRAVCTMFGNRTGTMEEELYLG